MIITQQTSETWNELVSMHRYANYQHQHVLLLLLLLLLFSAHSSLSASVCPSFFLSISFSLSPSTPMHLSSSQFPCINLSFNYFVFISDPIPLSFRKYTFSHSCHTQNQRSTNSFMLMQNVKKHFIRPFRSSHTLHFINCIQCIETKRPVKSTNVSQKLATVND